MALSLSQIFQLSFTSHANHNATKIKIQIYFTMKITCFLLAAALAALPQTCYCSAFFIGSSSSSRAPTNLSTCRVSIAARNLSLHLKSDEQHDDTQKCELSRRTALSTFAIIATSSPLLRPPIAV